MASQKAWVIIAGVGPGTGSHLARRFSQNYTVALLARDSSNFKPFVKEINDAGGQAYGFSTDISDAESVKSSFDKIKREMNDAQLAAAVYNVGGGRVRKPFHELSEEEMERGWSSNGRGAFLFSRAVLPLLLTQAKATPTYPPTLIFTSATAGIKASPQSATFAAGKFAMRGIAQSLAKEYGPQGIHVVNAIIDGVIDIERSKSLDLGHPEAKISPEAIADTYWFLHTQPRTCFTNELDLRPAVEKW